MTYMLLLTFECLIYKVVDLYLFYVKFGVMDAFIIDHLYII
jgi:hypothetical protein